MPDSLTVKKIDDKLKFRWPRLQFAVFEWEAGTLDISFDTLATEQEEKQIRKYIGKVMDLEFPNHQFNISRIPF